MAANDIIPDGFDADSARYDRLNRTQQAPFAPGQDAVFQQDDIFSQSSVPISSNPMSDIFSSGQDPFGGSSVGDDIFGSPNPFGNNNPFGPQGGVMGQYGGMQQPQQQQQRPKSQEDMIFDAVKSVFKGFISFIKDMKTGITSVTPLYWQYMGYHTLIISGVVILAGFVCRLFGLDEGFRFCKGGCFSAIVGVVTMMFTTDKARKCRSHYKDENNTLQDTSMLQQAPVEPAPAVEEPSFFNDTSDFGSFDSFDSESEDDYDVDDYWGSYSDSVEPEVVQSPGLTTEEALTSLENPPAGMYTRQFLYDMLMQRLSTVKPDFAELKTIDEDSSAFLAWDKFLVDAATVAGCKEDNMPELLKLQENVFTVIVTCSRPAGFKPEAVATELANIYAYAGGTKNPNVFAKYDAVGRECIITIFNGASVMISLKDMMLKEKAYFLDTNNKLPVVIGVDQLGNVITTDFKNIESIIITGMPRRGKSWFAQVVLTQLCTFGSPKDIVVYLFDPKDGISDFKEMRFPHVKRFYSSDDKIVAGLRALVKNEAPRRKRIIGDAGFVNIWDYKERYPDVNMPVIYVFIDEVVTLASRMDKETHNEFRMLLRELISQLPALGIRAILVPHVLNNDIIEKKTSDLVPCKLSVGGDADHIEKATGSKTKDFPYKLVNKGDMAVKLTGIQDTLYVKAPILSTSNAENHSIFDYIRRRWALLEPSEVKGSRAESADVTLENKEMLAHVNDEGEIEFTDEGKNGLSGMINTMNKFK